MLLHLCVQEDYNLTMYPELVINEKPRRGHPESQIWIISKVRMKMEITMIMQFFPSAVGELTSAF